MIAMATVCATVWDIVIVKMVLLRLIVIIPVREDRLIVDQLKILIVS